MLAMTLAGSSPIPVRLQSEESEKRPGAPGPGYLPCCVIRHPRWWVAADSVYLLRTLPGGGALGESLSQELPVGLSVCELKPPGRMAVRKHLKPRSSQTK